VDGVLGGGVAIEELSLLDGRYQLIRQLGGPPHAPLMVASDVKSGSVVCIRLQQFSTAMASLAAVPALAPAPQPPGDGPLLPYDFGVDEGTAYVVRDFVTGTSLQQLLAAGQPPSPLALVALLHRAGNALVTAADQGFRHCGLTLRHVLVAPDGTVRVAGYDHGQPAGRQSVAGEGGMLAALVHQAFGTAPSVDLPPPVRALLTRLRAGKGSPPPNLENVVRQLRRCEEQLRGHSRLRVLWTTSAHVFAALIRRFRHLGPLLHPYVIVLTLVAVIVVIAVHTLAAPASPGRILVYPIPAHPSGPSMTNYPFANPPAVVAAARPTPDTRAAAVPVEGPAPTIPSMPAIGGTTAAVADGPEAAPTASAALILDAPAARVSSTPRTVAAESNPPAPTTLGDAAVPRPAPQTAVHTLKSAPPRSFRQPTAVATSRALAPPATAHTETASIATTHSETAIVATTYRETASVATTRSETAGTATAPALSRSTVIVTSLTAAATTARVTVIAATSEATSISAAGSTQTTAVNALHPATDAAPPTGTTTVRSSTTATFSRAAALATK
jgi:hypothetical protein